MAFETMDLVMNPEADRPICFGWCREKTPENGQTASWYKRAVRSITDGWDDDTSRAVGRDLAKNVNECYFNFAAGTFHDLGDDRVWTARFVNDHNLWQLQLYKSPQAAVLPEDAEQFFASEEFRRFSKRCGDLIDRASDCYEEVVRQHVENGEMIDVDPKKLAREIRLSRLKFAMENLRTGKYELK